jgi:hypothetical protein
MSHRHASAPLLLVLLWATAATAQLDEPNGPEPPDVVELTGHAGKALPGETGGWSLTLGVGFTRTIHHYHLRAMRILNSGRLPLNVLAQLEPYRPTFYVFGDAAQMTLIATARPEQTLVLTGYRRRGSRNLMLTGARTSDAPITSPP